MREKYFTREVIKNNAFTAIFFILKRSNNFFQHNNSSSTNSLDLKLFRNVFISRVEVKQCLTNIQLE